MLATQQEAITSGVAVDAIPRDMQPVSSRDRVRRTAADGRLGCQRGAGLRRRVPGWNGDRQLHDGTRYLGCLSSGDEPVATRRKADGGETGAPDGAKDRFGSLPAVRDRNSNGRQLARSGHSRELSSRLSAARSGP